MSVTQKHIAAKLNISRSLVARALKGYPEVAESTRQRVQSVALEMGYSSSDNREARALISRRYGQQLKHGLIAVTFPPMDAVSPRFMPFYEKVINGIETTANELGVDICLCPLRPNEVPRLVRDRNVDGVIFLGYAPWHLAATHALALPIVSLQERVDNAHSVTHDQRSGTFQATQHLLDLGHRKIAYLGVTDGIGQIDVQRFQGYKDALRQNNIELQDKWIETSLRPPYATPTEYCSGCGVCAACAGWSVLTAKNDIPLSLELEKKELPFTALVCHNDPIAMGVIEHAKQQGFDVPNDLSVTGFDNVSREYHFQPTLTSVDLSLDVMGQDAMRLLHEDINATKDDDEASYQHHVLPVSLVVGDSTSSIETVQAKKLS